MDCALQRGSRKGKDKGRKRYTVEQIIRKLRDELLDGEIFYTLREAQVLIERWCRDYNRIRPHSSLGYRPPAPEAVEWPLGPTRPGTPTTMAGLT